MREYRQAQELTLHVDDKRNAATIEGYAILFDRQYKLQETKEYSLREVFDATAFRNCDFSFCPIEYSGRKATTAQNTLIIKADNKGLWIKASLGGAEGLQPGTTPARVYMAFNVAGDTRRVYDKLKKLTGKPVIVRTVTKVNRVYLFGGGSIPREERQAADDLLRREARSMLYYQRSGEYRTVFSTK